LDTIDFVEPKPGIPPSPAHIETLINEIKAQNVRLILMEPYFDTKLPEKIGRDTGAKVLVFPPSVGALPEIKTYTDLFDYDIKVLTDALQK
jgi:ABC-type Zn uptake system ZnuABC Zn-binding protein ZnuA